MLITVHGPLIAIVVTVLCSGICGLRINREDAVAVTDKPYGNSNLDVESLQLLEPLLVNENGVEIVPEDNIDAILRAFEEKQNQNEEAKKGTFIEVDNAVKKRVTRQAAHQYSPLYPQLPSGPPYNPYQPQSNNNSSGQHSYQPQPSHNPQQPGYNPYTQNPNQQQPGYNPYTQNPNQQQPGYNPYTQNPNQQQPGYNPYTQNSNQQQPGYNPYTQNPNQQPSAYNPYKPNGQNGQPSQWNTNSVNSSKPGYPNNNSSASFPNPNQSPYGPSPGQNPYNPRPNFPSNNNTSPGSAYRPPNGQYSTNNQTSNYQPNPASYRPPNASGSSFTTPLAPYSPRPGQSPYNNYPPSSGSSYPGQQINSSAQRPPYNPNQYPSYNNNSRPNSYPNSQYPNAQYPNYPGAQPAQGTYNVTRPQTSPYFPGPDGKFPSNSYNPSIPNYPPQNHNHGQNNFFYPQNNSSASYDPRRVPPQNYSY